MSNAYLVLACIQEFVLYYELICCKTDYISILYPVFVSQINRHTCSAVLVCVCLCVCVCVRVCVCVCVCV